MYTCNALAKIGLEVVLSNKKLSCHHFMTN